MADGGVLLAQLDSTRARAAYQESSSKVTFLKATRVGLQAEALGGEMKFPALLVLIRNWCTSSPCSIVTANATLKMVSSP